MEKKNEQSRAVMRTRTLQFAPPTLKEVIAYHAERKVESFEAEEFFDQYETRGWCLKDGSEIFDWRALLRQWVRQRKNDYLLLQRAAEQKAKGNYPTARNFEREKALRQAKEMERQRLMAEEREREQQERERAYEEQRKAHVSYEEYLRMKENGMP